MRAALAATFESLPKPSSSQKAIARLMVAALAFTLIIGFADREKTIQAGQEPAPLIHESLLPQYVGVGIPTGDPVAIALQAPMDPASVEAGLRVVPEQSFRVSWNAEHTELRLSPDRLWRTDESYLVIVPADAVTAADKPLGEPLRFAFTTQTAPVVSDFQVHLAGADLPSAEADAEATPGPAALRLSAPDRLAPAPEAPRTAQDVSASTAITVSFSVPMDRADVEGRFAIAPAVAGDLSWEGNDLLFKPSERLAAGRRYTVSVLGSHDALGNLVDGKTNFSFTVRAGAQLTQTSPEQNAVEVEAASVSMWFSQPMDVDATNAAFAAVDTAAGGLVAGVLSWNEAGTQLTLWPDNPLPGGRRFEIRIGDGARDADGNAVTATWSFATKVAVPASTSGPTVRGTTPPPPPPAPSGDLVGHAIYQINSARAAYGFAPLALDGAITAVSYAHAYDQAANNYYSHWSLDGRSPGDRLRAGGVSFSYSGENQCYHYGMGAAATLEWCHNAFMIEPYPGYPNHIGNILSPNARRVGIGIATVGSTTVITWDFTN